jgi:hypothetical protein
MKFTLYLLIFLNLSFCFSQSVVQKYNSLYNRYEFINESGKMVAYKTYNSLLNQWEIYSSEDNNRKTDYGNYVAPVNLELLARVMAQKQARYDNLSYEQKRRLSQQEAYRKYTTRQNQVTDEFFKVYDKSQKTYSTIVKSGIKNFKENKNKDLKNILTFSDGWYNCFFISEAQSSVEETPKAVNYDRYLQVINGKVINYVGNYNIIYPVINTKSSSSFLTLTIETKLGKQENVLIYAVSDKPLKSVPEFYSGISKIFYTTVQEGSKIDIIIKNKNDYTYLGKISQYWKDETILNCDIEKGVIKVNLPPGVYEYFAFGDTEIWEGEFSLNDNDYCHKTKLISN